MVTKHQVSAAIAGAEFCFRQEAKRSPSTLQDACATEGKRVAGTGVAKGDGSDVAASGLSPSSSVTHAPDRPIAHKLSSGLRTRLEQLDRTVPQLISGTKLYDLQKLRFFGVRLFTMARSLTGLGSHRLARL